MAHAHVTAAASDEAVRQRAYEIWEGHGRPHGRDMEHWLEAKAALAAEAQNPAPPAEAAPAPRKRTAKAPEPAEAKAAAPADTEVEAEPTPKRKRGIRALPVVGSLLGGKDASA